MGESSHEAPRAQVAIVGAGPAGLVLCHMLARRDIDSVVLESRSRSTSRAGSAPGCSSRARSMCCSPAGWASGWTARASSTTEWSCASAARDTGSPSDRARRWRGISDLRAAEIVKDLIAARLAAGGCRCVSRPRHGVAGVDADSPAVIYRRTATASTARLRRHRRMRRLPRRVPRCRPRGHAADREHGYPFGWLGILAEVPPSTRGARSTPISERGFALHSLRSPKISRLYLQCRRTTRTSPAGRTSGSGPSSRAVRRDDGWELEDGPILEKGITPMRSFVAEPMQHGRLFLAGDAAHIVPPTGAKGLNLAVADVRGARQTRWSRWYDERYAPSCWTPTRTPASGGSGAPSTSRSG